MLINTIAFIFIVGCYLIIVTTVFTTLFANADPDHFGIIVISLR